MEELPRYQTLLKQELDDRVRANAKYSARALARDLDLSAAYLSQLMSGKRSLGDETAELISRKLNWGLEKRKAFLILAQIERTKSADLKNSLKLEYERISTPVTERPGFRKLKLDSFNLISDWYYIPLLELTEIARFKPDPHWIAKKLRLPIDTAKAAIIRLQQVKLLSLELKKIDSVYRMGDVPSLAIRKFHKQMLKMAEYALDTQVPDQRDFSSCTMSIDPKKIPLARELIRNFQKELIELMASDEKSAVYQMSMQFFRLDQEDDIPNVK